MIGEIKSLHPAFKMAVDQILIEMKAKGWDAVIGSGMRTWEQQAALFAQGRESLEKVNSLRVKSGLPSTTASDNARIVTHARAGESNHNLTTWLLRSSARGRFDVMNGYAVDIVSKRDGWDPHNKKFWTDLGFFAKKYACEWGGNWKGSKYDPAHVQMKIIDSATRDSALA